MKVSYKRGFTLIELLVVIAIIGILSSVVLASLNSARVKGRIAAAQSTLKSLSTALALCLNDGTAINIPTAAINGGGGAVCAGSASVYGALPTGWLYNDGAGTPASTQDPGVSFSISAHGDSKVITCTESGCTTT